MRKRVTNRVAVVALVVFLVFGASPAFYLHMRQADDLRQQTAFFTAFDACDKHMSQDKAYVSFTDPANIPCFQKALKAGPDESFKLTGSGFKSVVGSSAG